MHVYKLIEIIFCKGLLLFAKNIPILLIQTKPNEPENVEHVNCDLGADQQTLLIWQKLFSFFYSIIPFMCLIVINSFIIYRTLKKPSLVEPMKNLRRERFNLRKKRMSLVITILTIGFCVFTIPTAIISYLFEILNEGPPGILLTKNTFILPN